MINKDIRLGYADMVARGQMDLTTAESIMKLHMPIVAPSTSKQTKPVAKVVLKPKYSGPNGTLFRDGRGPPINIGNIPSSSNDPKTPIDKEHVSDPSDSE